MLISKFLFEEPFLNRRERNVAGQDSLLCLYDLACTRDRSQFCDRLMFEDVVRRQAQTERVRPRGDAQAEYRVAAEFEEVVVNADSFKTEQLTPETSD